MVRGDVLLLLIEQVLLGGHLRRWPARVRGGRVKSKMRSELRKSPGT